MFKGAAIFAAGSSWGLVAGFVGGLIAGMAIVVKAQDATSMEYKVSHTPNVTNITEAAK